MEVDLRYNVYMEEVQIPPLRIINPFHIFFAVCPNQTLD